MLKTKNRFAPLLCGVALLTLAGCAAQSPVTPAGNGSYMVSKQAATGFPGLGNLKSDELLRATEFCDKQNQELHVISSTETKPPFILGNYPRVEILFNCAPRT